MKQLHFKSNRQDEAVPLNKVEYIEIFNRKCYVHIRNLSEPLTTYAKLSDLNRQLNDTFVKINRSCIVSLNYIKIINTDTIVLKNNVEVLPSKALFSQICDKYRCYIANMNKINTPIQYIKISFNKSNIPNNLMIQYTNGTTVNFEGNLSYNI